MSSWTRVREHFQDTMAAEKSARERERRATTARQELEAWYDRAERSLMHELALALREHASELASSGVAVQVVAPASRVLSTPAGEFRRAVQVLFLDAEVLLYSARSAHGPLMVHFARVFRSKRRNRPRLVSVPGFRVRRGAAGEMLLEAVGPEAGQAPVRVVDVACRVMSMLVQLAAVRRSPPPRQTEPCAVR
jgi:hypothetical protein